MLTPHALLLATRLFSIDLTISGGAGPSSSSGNGSQMVTTSGEGALLLNAGGNFVNFGVVALGWELPVAFGGPSRTLVGSVPGGGSVTYGETTNWVVTPGLRARILPLSRLTPWASIGVGAAGIGRSTVVSGLGGASTPSDNTYSAVLSVAGGVDFKLLKFLLLRGEVRHYTYSTGEGVLSIFSIFQGDYRNHLMFFGGVGVRF